MKNLAIEKLGAAEMDMLLGGASVSVSKRISNPDGSITIITVTIDDNGKVTEDRVTVNP